MSQAKGSPTPSRLPTGSSTTSSSTSRPATNATTPLLPPISESHQYHVAPAVSSSLISGSNGVGPVDQPRPTGVRKTSTQINQRLGFFSSSDEPRSVGSQGYISPSYMDLKPVAPGSWVSAKPHGPKVSSLRSLHNGNSRISERDVQFLREREADNQQVFDVWSQRKHLELEMEREEQERRIADAQARFETREQLIQEQNGTVVKQWEQRKAQQQKDDAEENYLKQIKLRALQVYHHRINHAYEVKCKKREEGFAVRSGVAHLQGTFDEYRAQRGKWAHKPLGKEKSGGTYRSLLDEADRAGDEEAAFITMMGGTHPLVAIARQKSGDLGVVQSEGGALDNVSQEPSFATVPRHGNTGGGVGALPPLSRHLVPPNVLAQYLPPLSQSGRKLSEGGALVIERSLDNGGGVDCHPTTSSLSDEGIAAPQAILPPNITSIYAPREIIGSIVQDAHAEAQEAFHQRLQEAAQDSLRPLDAPYPMAPPHSAAAATGPTESSTTATDDSATRMHISPAFFATYGKGNDDGAAALPPPPPPLRSRSQTTSASHDRPKNVRPGGSDEEESYSDVFPKDDGDSYGGSGSGSGFGPQQAVGRLQPSLYNNRQESGGSVASYSTATQATVPITTVPIRLSSAKRKSRAARETSELSLSESPHTDVGAAVEGLRHSRRESAVETATVAISGSRTTSLSASDDHHISEVGPSPRQSAASSGSQRAMVNASSSRRSGGSRRGSIMDRTPSESSVAGAAGFQDEALSGGGDPSRRESVVSGGSSMPTPRDSYVTTARGSASDVGRSAQLSARSPQLSSDSVVDGVVGRGSSRQEESAANILSSDTAGARGPGRSDSFASTSGRASPGAVGSRRSPDPAVSASMSGSDALLFAPSVARHSSRPESGASYVSEPLSAEDKEVAAAVTTTVGTAASGGASLDTVGSRRSNSLVGVEPSLGFLPLAAGAAARSSNQAAGKGVAEDEDEYEDDEDVESEESEESEPQTVKAAGRKAQPRGGNNVTRKKSSEEGEVEEEEEEEEEEAAGRSGTRPAISSDDESETEEETEDETEDDETEELEAPMRGARAMDDYSSMEEEDETEEDDESEEEGPRAKPAPSKR